MATVTLIAIFEGLDASKKWITDFSIHEDKPYTMYNGQYPLIYANEPKLIPDGAEVNTPKLYVNSHISMIGTGETVYCTPKMVNEIASIHNKYTEHWEIKHALHKMNEVINNTQDKIDEMASVTNEVRKYCTTLTPILEVNETYTESDANDFYLLDELPSCGSYLPFIFSKDIKMEQEIYVKANTCRRLVARLQEIKTHDDLTIYHYKPTFDLYTNTFVSHTYRDAGVSSIFFVLYKDFYHQIIHYDSNVFEYMSNLGLVSLEGSDLLYYNWKQMFSTGTWFGASAQAMTIRYTEKVMNSDGSNIRDVCKNMGINKELLNHYISELNASAIRYFSNPFDIAQFYAMPSMLMKNLNFLSAENYMPQYVIRVQWQLSKMADLNFSNRISKDITRYTGKTGILHLCSFCGACYNWKISSLCCKAGHRKLQSIVINSYTFKISFDSIPNMNYRHKLREFSWPLVNEHTLSMYTEHSYLLTPCNILLRIWRVRTEDLKDQKKLKN